MNDRKRVARPRARQLQPADAPPPAGAYSPGLVIDGWVFVSGQGPLDPVTGELIGETVEDQTEQVLLNIAAVLDGAGAGLSDVVMVTAHLADIESFERFDQAYASMIGDPKPTRTTVGSELGGEGMLVEIAVIARVGRTK